MHSKGIQRCLDTKWTTCLAWPHGEIVTPDSRPPLSAGLKARSTQDLFFKTSFSKKPFRSTTAARNHQALNHSPTSTMMGPSRQRKRPSPILLVKSEKPIPKAPQTPSVKEASTNPSLLTYNEIPEWYQDNECIVYGYRPPTNSTAKCFASWGYIHNETFNIFSHVLPAILSLVCAGVMPSYFFDQYHGATTGDQLVFGFFLLSAAVCLSLSSIYHTLMNHSASVSKTWLRLDYVGIMILTLGDFVSGIYLVFYCEPTLQRVYWTMVSADPITTSEI